MSDAVRLFFGMQYLYTAFANTRCSGVLRRSGKRAEKKTQPGKCVLYLNLKV